MNRNISTRITRIALALALLVPAWNGAVALPHRERLAEVSCQFNEAASEAGAASADRSIERVAETGEANIDLAPVAAGQELSCTVSEAHVAFSPVPEKARSRDVGLAIPKGVLSL